MSTRLWTGRWSGSAFEGDVHRRSREVINPSGGIMRCKFPSRKNGRLVHCEGLLELDAAYLFEAHPRVARYREQPAPFLFPDGERVRRYTPDFELTLDNGEAIWVEVKPTRSLADKEIRRKLRCLQDHMRRSERRFLVLTDEELRAEPRQSNVRTIWRSSTRTLPSRPAALAVALRHAEQLPCSLKQAARSFDAAGVDVHKGYRLAVDAGGTSVAEKTMDSGRKTRITGYCKTGITTREIRHFLGDT